MIDSITTTQPPQIYKQKGSIKKMSDTRCETKSSPARRTVSFAQTDSEMGQKQSVLFQHCPNSERKRSEILGTANANFEL